MLDRYGAVPFDLRALGAVLLACVVVAILYIAATCGRRR